MNPDKNRNEIILLLLRIGVAFAFIYPAIAAYFNPLAWIGFFPLFVRDFFPSDTILLGMFGLSEILIGMWLLAGKKIFIPSAIATLYLFGIIVFNWALMDIIFRDIPILLTTLALTIWSFNGK